MYPDTNIVPCEPGAVVEVLISCCCLLMSRPRLGKARLPVQSGRVHMWQNWVGVQSHVPSSLEEEGILLPQCRGQPLSTYKGTRVLGPSSHSHLSCLQITGPWRSLWIRFGYDPRKHPEAKIYQVLDFRIRCGMKYGKNKKLCCLSLSVSSFLAFSSVAQLCMYGEDKKVSFPLCESVEHSSIEMEVLVLPWLHC
jgi:hypothetical protein